jgi:LysM repeat protein
MKKILFVLFLMPLLAHAQKGKEIKPVKMHTVGAKESLSSIGRLYEVNGRVLANYNNIDYDKGISIGQVLKIPPKGTTLEQLAPPSGLVVETVKKEEAKVQAPVTKSEPIAEIKDETGSPVYHKVGKKETLYRITTLYPGTSIDDLKKWNNLAGDAVTEGANLIVGYKSQPTGNKKPAVEKEKPVLTETVKKEPEIKVKEPEVKPSSKTDAAGKAIKGGAFKTLYESQNGSGNAVNEEGSLAVFKSTSGWKDGKYYCLYNNANPGTIIRITAPTTGKFVYAKVLDMMPDLKQNDGLLVLISNAAAEELGITDSNSKCSISYSK